MKNNLGKYSKYFKYDSTKSSTHYVAVLRKSNISDRKEDTYNNIKEFKKAMEKERQVYEIGLGIRIQDFFSKLFK